MPIYEYTCSECQKVSDVLQKLNEPAPERCPACGAQKTLSRIVSRTSFVLKGGGWGADLYGSKKAAEKTEAAPADGAKAADKTAAPATDAAPAASSGASTSSTPAPAPATSSTSDKKDSGS